jgi:hypothetical protein
VDLDLPTKNFYSPGSWLRIRFSLGIDSSVEVSMARVLAPYVITIKKQSSICLWSALLLRKYGKRLLHLSNIPAEAW